jgi:hypothetical protein
MKPKSNYKPSTMDNCQSPPYAVEVLIPYLPRAGVIWEPAAGDGYIVETLERSGFSVIAGDVKRGQDYFFYEPAAYTAQVTNPPWNQYQKYAWIRRAYQLGKPFALLMQTETIGVGEAIKEFVKNGIEIIQPIGRINYKMPVKGWDSNAQMPSAWFTWGLGIGQALTFVDMGKYVPTGESPQLEPVNLFAGQMQLFTGVQ